MGSAATGVPSSTEIVATSNVREGAISPDGKYLALVVEEEGRQSVKIQAPNNANESLTIANGGTYRGLVFSRDAYSVYYLARGEKGSDLYQVSVVGGPPRKLVSDIDTPISTSPDGSQLAFVRRKEAAPVLIVAKADGSGQRELATAPSQSEFGTFLINNAPAWSPDGKVIACPIMTTGDPMQMSVVGVRVEDGGVIPIGPRHWFLIGQLGWLTDGTGLIMDAQESMPPQTTPQIWLLDYPGGNARVLTTDTGFYHGVSLTADSSTLITTKTSSTSKIWIMSDSLAGSPIALQASKNKGSGGIAWTTDGNLVYASNESGTMEIWFMDGAGINSRQLTFNKQTCVEPALSRHDSERLVFACYSTGKPHIWRIDQDGNNLKQLTSGGYEDWPDFSPDGQSVIYHSAESSGDRIWKLSIDGGSSTLLTDKIARHPVFSPDGKSIACFTKDEGSTWQLTVLPVADTSTPKYFALPISVADQWAGPRWTTDGKAISYIVTNGGVSNVWKQPLTGGPATQLTNFSEDQIFAFAWSVDGKRLALVRGVNAKSIILMKNFRRS